MFSVKHSSVISVAAIALLWSIPGNAKSEISYKIPTGFGWRVGIPLHLLELEAVQKDLGLSPETSYKLSRWKTVVTEAARGETTAIRDAAKLREIHQQAQANIQSDLELILTQAQQERLHEIDLQLAGLEALSDRTVASSIGLAPEQSARITAIHNRMRKEEMDSIKGSRKAGTSTTDRDKQLLDVLKPEQQEKFASMKGVGFDSSGSLPNLRLKDRELEIWNVSFSPDGKRLASSRQNDIFIWDVDSGKLISRMQGHAGNITCLSFGPDGKWLISSSTDRTVRSWEVETGKNLVSHGGKHTAFNGRFIPGLGPDCIRSFALSPDGTQLAHANGNSISISMGINPLVPPFFQGSESYPGGVMERLPVWTVAFNTDGKRYACGRIDGSVYLMGFGMPKKISAATDAVLRVAFSPDGQQFATASADGTVNLWNATDGLAIASLPPHETAARCAAFNHDSSLVVSAGEDGIVRVISRSRSAATIELAAHEGKATAAAFHPTDNRMATTGSDGIVRIWSESGRELFALDPSAN